MDSDQTCPLCSTVHCNTVLMINNMTSDCKMLTRLANRGQNGGKTGGGSAENKVIIGFFCRTCFKKQTNKQKKHQKTIPLLHTFDSLQRIFIYTHLKAVSYLLRSVKCIKTAL